MEKTREYKRQLNSILRTSMKITECVAQDKIRDVQLWTILLNHQIEETLEMMKESNGGIKNENENE